MWINVDGILATTSCPIRQPYEMNLCYLNVTSHNPMLPPTALIFQWIISPCFCSNAFDCFSVFDKVYSLTFSLILSVPQPLVLLTQVYLSHCNDVNNRHLQKIPTVFLALSLAYFLSLTFIWLQIARASDYQSIILVLKDTWQCKKVKTVNYSLIKLTFTKHSFSISINIYLYALL